MVCVYPADSEIFGSMYLLENWSHKLIVCFCLQLKLAHFYRFFCRFTVILARSEDRELITTADARKTIFCHPLEGIIGFLQSLRTAS